MRKYISEDLRKQRHRNRYTTGRNLEIYQKWLSGMTVKDIAKAHKMGASMVSYIVKEAVKAFREIEEAKKEKVAT